MRRILALLALWPALAFGATKYIDSGCTTSCDGTVIDCGTGGGCHGPWKTFEDARTAWACGDTVNVRGVHATHGSNHSAGTTDGRYSTTDFVRVGNACSSGSPLIIQANGWTAVGAGTQETVYLEGTADPGAWTQCVWGGASCNAPCAGLTTQAICQGTWYVDAPSPMNLSIGAEKPDGTPTPRQTALANITAQYQSYSAETAVGNLFVYWGTGADAPGGANNPKPYVFYDNNGNGFFFCDNSFCTGWPQYVTIRGLTIRDTRSAAVVAKGENNTVQDNVIKYSVGTYVSNTGSDYGIAASVGFANNWTIDSNDISYTGSEAIHFQAQCAAATDCTNNGVPCLCCTGSGTGPTCGATVVTITNNYIHDTGDSSVLGPAITFTPSGMILGNHGTGSTGNSDFTGSKVQGNILKNIGGGASPTSWCGRGIILENVSSNWVIRDNIFDHTWGPALKIEASSGGTGCNGNQFFNNIVKDADYGGSCAEGAAAIFLTSGGGTGTLDSNTIYNNTFASVNNAVITQNCAAKCTNNLIRNNIASAGTLKCIGWTDTDSTNKWENNLCFTSANPAATWLNVGYTSANIAAGCSTNCTGSVTGDPLFVNSATDFHIQSGSPAKDAGTSTGMPAGRTTDICNSIASAHGFVSYNDCLTVSGTPDIGADELPSGSRRVMLVCAPSLEIPATFGAN